VTVRIANWGVPNADLPPEVLDGADPAVLEAEGRAEPHRGQLRMAYRLARAFGDGLRFVHQVGWHLWDGTRWREDDRGAARRRVVEGVLRPALAEAVTLDRTARDSLMADVRRCESAAGVAGVLSLAESLPPFAVTLTDLDCDPWLLNCANGTLDLRTGELRRHDSADLLTKITGAEYDPDATGEAFSRFLAEILPDAETRAFVQRIGGLALVGQVVEHVLPIFTGTGRNGKSTLLNVVRDALGEYAIEAAPDLLIDRDRAHPTGLLDLRGVRLAVCQESDDGRRLAVATVKRLTGGDRIRARRMRQDFVEFSPSHTAVLVTNHKPRVPGDDPALWRRLRVVPFDVVVPEPDVRLPDRLALELPAVLAWLVAGHGDYTRRGGLDEPVAVTEATTSYKASSDVLGRFLEERILSGSSAMYVRASELFAAWQAWCAQNGEHPGRTREFAEAITQRGFERKERSIGRVYVGLTLLADEGSGG
jgi:putative DNA primase/helicase